MAARRARTPTSASSALANSRSVSPPLARPISTTSSCAREPGASWRAPTRWVVGRRLRVRRRCSRRWGSRSSGRAARSPTAATTVRPPPMPFPTVCSLPLLTSELLALLLVWIDWKNWRGLPWTRESLGAEWGGVGTIISGWGALLPSPATIPPHPSAFVLPFTLSCVWCQGRSR